MMKRFLYIALILLLTSCGAKKHYAISSITGQYIPVTDTDKHDSEIADFVDKYKKQLDREMNQVIGTSAQYMTTDAPESLLTNMTTDVMMLLDGQYTNNLPVDLAFMNVHGIRAPIAEGTITVGDIYSTFPFENTLACLRIKGKYLKEIFASIAKSQMVGVSGNVKLEIKDTKVISSTINGQSIDDNKIYTIVTLDYLADGNDTMDAFTKSESTEQPGITLRGYMIDYIQRLAKDDKKLSSKLDGRIAIK